MSEIIKSIRIDDRRGNADGSRLDIVQDGKRRYAIWHDYEIKNNLNKSKKFDRSLEPDEIIKEVIGSYNKIQDPYSETPPIKRIYGKTPYYLNDGSFILIKWYPYSGGKDQSYNDDFDGSYKSVEIYPPAVVNGTDTYKFDTSSGIVYSSKIQNELKFGNQKDSDIKNDVLQKIKFIRSTKNGININDIKIEFCNPDTGPNTSIKFVDYLKTPDTQQIDTTIKATQSVNKIPMYIDDLPDVIQIKALTNLPEFTIWVGDRISLNSDEYDSTYLNMLIDSGYIESTYQGEEEKEVKFLLNTSVSDYDAPSQSYDLPSQNGGRSGNKQFQKSMNLNKTVFNGDLPDDLLLKLDFCGLKLEKHAAIKLNELNNEYKKKFGENISISSGYRTFNVQNSIFDWDFWIKNKQARKLGTNGGTAAAKPGTSKHGWGLAIDTIGVGDVGSAKFNWLEDNGKRFGWINPDWAKKSGPGHEPWHREYIGNDVFKDSIA